MTNLVKGALILGGSIIIAASIVMYFSPYQTCVRAERLDDKKIHSAEIRCAAVLAGRK